MSSLLALLQKVLQKTTTVYRCIHLLLISNSIGTKPPSSLSIAILTCMEGPYNHSSSFFNSLTKLSLKFFSFVVHHWEFDEETLIEPVKGFPCLWNTYKQIVLGPAEQCTYCTNNFFPGIFPGPQLIRITITFCYFFLLLGWRSDRKKLKHIVLMRLPKRLIP